MTVAGALGERTDVPVENLVPSHASENEFSTAIARTLASFEQSRGRGPNVRSAVGSERANDVRRTFSRRCSKWKDAQTFAEIVKIGPVIAHPPETPSDGVDLPLVGCARNRHSMSKDRAGIEAPADKHGHARCPFQEAGNDAPHCQSELLGQLIRRSFAREESRGSAAGLGNTDGAYYEGLSRFDTTNLSNHGC
jgi:hypothetical protein